MVPCADSGGAKGKRGTARRYLPQGHLSIHPLKATEGANPEYLVRAKKIILCPEKASILLGMR